MPSHTEIGEFIWRIADHLRGDYEKNDNEDVILPFTLLRRLDCVLETTRDKVRQTEAKVAGKVKDDVLKKLLVDAAGVPFYNRSKFSFAELLKDAANIKDNFGAWLEGYSDNIKEILYNFSGGEEKGLAPIYETLARKNLLYLITKEFASDDLDLHPDVVSNHDMGLIYEYLIRKFKEGAAAGEQYTPRDVVQLLVQLVFADVEHSLKSAKGSLVGIYDPAAGTGGMITVAKEYLTSQWGLDPTNVFIYGQELREKTFAICKADALMKGDDGSRIKQGNTLSDDKLIGHQFNFMLANPEFGTDWKKIQDFITKEAERGFDGRFGAGLPDVGDASLLFLLHMISKMTPVDKGGSVIGIVFNGSPLFNGDAGSGWSDIRKWIITNDWLDAIVALPEDMFYNTNIATYLWIVRNNKPADRQGTITLVNGNQERFRTLMRRNLGKKRVELTQTTIDELVDVLSRRQAGAEARAGLRSGGLRLHPHRCRAPAAAPLRDHGGTARRVSEVGFLRWPGADQEGGRQGQGGHQERQGKATAPSSPRWRRQKPSARAAMIARFNSSSKVLCPSRSVTHSSPASVRPSARPTKRRKRCCSSRWNRTSTATAPRPTPATGMRPIATSATKNAFRSRPTSPPASPRKCCPTRPMRGWTAARIRWATRSVLPNTSMNTVRPALSRPSLPTLNRWMLRLTNSKQNCASDESDVASLSGS